MSYKDGPPAQGGKDKAPQAAGKPPKKALKARTITVTVTIPTFITGCIGFAVSIFIVFFLGIILGRGHFPEEKIPTIKKMMPAPVVIAPAKVTGNEPTTAAGVDVAFGNNAANATSVPTSPRSTPIMTAQDLDYHASLKDKPKVNAGSKPQVKSAGKAATSSTRIPKKETATPKSTTKPDAKPATKPEVKATTEKFIYQFQVAAYKNKEQADAFTAKLVAGGISAKTEKSIENGKVWFKNIVSFKGTPDDVDVLREKLKVYKVTTLIRKSKTPTK